MTTFTLKRLVSAMAALGILSYALPGIADQKLVDSLSQQLEVNYRIVSNHTREDGTTTCIDLGADWGACNRAMITLTNTGDAVSDRDWAIYFHSIRLILAVESDQFKISHITGDLHKLEPTDKFKGFAARQAVEIPIIGEYWQIFKTDVMPRWYVTSTGAATPKVIHNTDTEDLNAFMAPIDGIQWKRNLSDKTVLMTSKNRFAKNADIAILPTQALRGQIVPTPMSVTVYPQDANLSSGIKLELDVLPKATAAFIAERFALFGVKSSSKGYPVSAKIEPEAFKDSMAVAGAYQLKITDKATQIIAYDQSGVFYALQSVLSLLPPSGKPVIATLDVKDAPRFEYRGMFLDVGRNFRSVEAVKRLLDQMASYKLNKFHFHLSDDEGWRIEIPGLPELTEIGSQRCHDLAENRCLLPQLGSGPENNNMGSGYFSRAEYIDIVKYANARQIEVIPEIDVPAHARAAVIAMEARYRRLHKEGQEQQANEFRLLDPLDTSNTMSVQFYDRHSYLNPCLDSSRRFVDKVIGEMAAMHNEAGQPIKTWHFGGDEAKNIRLGAGFQDVNADEKSSDRGIIDLSKEDKPWARSPVCQQMVTDGKVADIAHLPSYFAIEVSKLVNAHGIDRMQAWQDGLKAANNAGDFATKRVGVNFWDTLFWGGANSVNDWANKGYEVVISNPDYVYLDFPYEANPQERGYYWGTRFNDERKIFAFAPNNLPQNAEISTDADGHTFSAKSDKAWPGAYGISGHSWNETVRTDLQMEYMVFPRVLALAERAWHRAEWELDYQEGREFEGGKTHYIDSDKLHADWLRFANIMGQRELARLDKAGIAYRIPVPGARIHKGKLESNIALPGLKIEYSFDEGKTWRVYDDANKPEAKNKVMIRAVSPDGKRVSRIETLN